MVEVELEYSSPIVRVEYGSSDNRKRIWLALHEARELHAKLEACLGAVDAEKHPSNPGLGMDSLLGTRP